MNDQVEAVSEALASRGLRLALAESCTGGMVAERLTSRAGASRFLEAGFVVYSNEAKESVLGVDRASLVAHGAVSEVVAGEMLDGARRVTGAEAAIAITGVAGPGGGTPEKPVGTVWVGADLEGRRRVERHRFDGNRAAIREAAADTALRMLDALLRSRDD